MTKEALRSAMHLASRSRDQEIGMAFFELLLATPVHVALEEAGQPSLTPLENGQPALFVFLDPPATASRQCSLPAAAQLALAHENAWLMVEPGAEPGNQVVGRPSLELLARGTHPLAQASQERHDLIRDFLGALQAGHVDPGLADRARSTNIVTLAAGAAAAPQLELASVADSDGTPLLVVWPTMAPSFVSQPAAARRAVMPLARLIDNAIQSGRGLLIQSSLESVSVPASTLAALWNRPS